jgi:sensor histidine kinase YesM
MPDTSLRNHFSSNTEMYLPYLYPVLMPILTQFATRVPIQSFQDALTYCFFTGFLQLVLLVLIQKIIYSGIYNQPIRWFIAFIVGGIALSIYMFLEFNVFHFTARLAYTNKWTPIPRYMLNIPILIAIIESIKSATERKNIIVKNIMLENENAKAQLHLLLQQINPHFLFNCLTVLQAMSRSKDARTEEFIVKMGSIYRQTLETEKGTVTLQEELDFFNAYMYLMGLRQENTIFVDVKVSDKSLAYHLPSFALQLLGENCMKHNIASKAKPLYLTVYQKDAKSLTVSNNYQPKTQKGESFGIGITNLKQRYALEGIKQGVLIEQNETIYSTTIKLF